MREIRNAFLQQRIFYTEARQGQKMLGENRAPLFQEGRHLLAEGYWALRDSTSTQRTLEQWKTKKIRAWKWINVLLFAENCTFFVVDEWCLNFKAFVHACFHHKKALQRWATKEERPRAPSLVKGEDGAVWGAEAQPQMREPTNSSKVQIPWERNQRTRTPRFADIRQWTVSLWNFQMN